MRHDDGGDRACHDGREGRRGQSRRFFGRGDVKYAFLELLSQQPMHGYQIMKALEEKSGGLYSPSPGSIYPTLQMLEDRSFVHALEEEGKKVYRISDDGMAFLQSWKQDNKQSDLLNFNAHNRDCEENWQQMRHAGKALFHMMWEVEHHPELGVEQMKQLQQLYERTLADVRRIGSMPSTKPNQGAE